MGPVLCLASIDATARCLPYSVADALARKEPAEPFDTEVAQRLDRHVVQSILTLKLLEACAVRWRCRDRCAVCGPHVGEHDVLLVKVEALTFGGCDCDELAGCEAVAAVRLSRTRKPLERLALDCRRRLRFATGTPRRLGVGGTGCASGDA